MVQYRITRLILPALQLDLTSSTITFQIENDTLCEKQDFFPFLLRMHIVARLDYSRLLSDLYNTNNILNS